MIVESVDEFRIIRNVLIFTRGLQREKNWIKVKKILLMGSEHAGRDCAIAKCEEIGVDPFNSEWEIVI